MPKTQLLFYHELVLIFQPSMIHLQYVKQLGSGQLCCFARNALIQRCPGHWQPLIPQRDWSSLAFSNYHKASLFTIFNRDRHNAPHSWCVSHLWVWFSIVNICELWSFQIVPCWCGFSLSCITSDHSYCNDHDLSLAIINRINNTD